MDDASLPHSNPTPAGSGSPGLPSFGGREARRATRSARRARLAFETPRQPEATSAWLHVVSGASHLAVARGALELAGRFLAGGHRVLIVDGGPRLKLHDRFDREARWGVTECLTGEMPVLGLVQELGRLGLYLLAHGMPARRTEWPQMGRLLDEARPHFGRVVLAVEPDAPSALGEALAGWHLEGWWAEPERGRRRAVRLADRLRIHLSNLDLEPMPDAKLETLDVRLWTLTALAARAPEASPAPSPPAPVEGDPGLSAPAHVPTIVATVEGDPRVRERLRFLVWMRRVHTEGSRPDRARPPLAAGVSGA
jgi:hypothetical protein